MNDHSDAQLIKGSLAGEHASFEILVQRYQVLVCSIAYSIVGNVAASEDVGQEVFLTVWKKLSELRDTKQLKSWLATITRNQSRAWLRRRQNLMQQIEEPTQVPQSTVEDDNVDQEEADLVWQALSQLPDSYREPLVLYYRREQSVAEVAEELSLSLSAAKQRLARGREMLRTEVHSMIERSLRKSVPTTAFTLAVMSLVTGTTQTAAAATGVATAKLATAAGKTALGGAATGTLIGLLGGFFGGFASWYNAEYQSQRTLIVRQGVVYLIGMAIFMLPFLAMLLGWQPVQSLGEQGYGIAYAVWMLFFMSLNFLWIFWCIRSYNKLQQQERDANTQRMPRYEKALQEGIKATGRRWKSTRTLFGLPLVQVAFPDHQVGIDDATIARQGTARAWIAIGHFATGRVLAIGHRAQAPIAIGNQAIGIVSLGVFSLGIFSLGVVSIAPLAAGVICLGGISFGGAIAVGYLAVAPLAFALKAAKGAMVFSSEFAEGALAFAPHANDEAARQFIASSSWTQQLDQWLQALAMQPGSNYGYWIGGFILLLAVAQRLAFKRAS